ncbi:MAG: butyrate kinase [Gemmatimonadales bacterium]|nr:butyrate kinase [Gemmatimonadales bacterium]
MYDIESSLDSQIIEVMKNKPAVIFTEATDPRIIEAACYLPRFARPVFLASEEAIKEIIRVDLPDLDPVRVEFALSEGAFIKPSERDDLVDEFARAIVDLPQGMGLARDLAEAREFVSRPSLFGIMAVRQGHADIVVGGILHEPREYFRPMAKLLAKQEVLCEAGVIVLPDDHPEEIFPHNILVVGDVGANAFMNPEVLANVAVGTCAAARDLFPEEVLPTINGAIVSYSNRGSDEGPSPELVRKATELVPEVLADRIKLGQRYETIRIEGEVKISVAMSRRSAHLYRRGQGESHFVGGTNVIIVPNLDTGNLLFHLYATRYPTAKKFSVMFGIRFQAVDLPMDCTAEDAMLGVKACILRMHKFGHWSRTPKDTFFPRYRTLAINPGSTSTKIAVFEGELERFTQEIEHSAEELKPFEGKRIVEQYEMRRDVVLAALADHGISVDDLDAVSGRGGLLRPIPHGTYRINDKMVEDLLTGTGGDHASNLGALISREIAAGKDIPAFIVDPVVVDEVPEMVKVTGMKDIRRQVISHALNQISTARRFAEEQETFYEYLNLIVCHMGGGITVGAHANGRYIDVNNGLDGEGPFSPQRSGSEPTGQLIRLCFSGKYTLDELLKLNKGRGGLIDLLGTADFREVERRIDKGDALAIEVYEAMVYQICKNITALLPAFRGEGVDRVLLTGGLARSQRLVSDIEVGVQALGCGVTAYPGENEMFALAKGVLRVLDGKEQPCDYDPS